MPLYEYECGACGHRFERIQRFSDAPVQDCPKCGGGPVHKLLSAPAIHFKGTGWYITDYGSRKNEVAESSSSKAESASKADSSSKTESSSNAAPSSKPDSSSKTDSSSSSSDTSGSGSSGSPAASSSGAASGPAKSDS